MKTKIVNAVVVSIVGILVFGLFVSPAAVQAEGLQRKSADETTPPWKQTLAPVRATLSAALPTQNGTVLENFLVRENLALSNQQTRLTLSHKVSETTQSYIDNQKEAGKDVSSLESALNSFNQAIIQSETYNATAASLLADPAGFDSSGQVTDRESALQTLRQAGQALRQAHLTLTQASLNLRIAIQTYRNN